VEPALSTIVVLLLQLGLSLVAGVLYLRRVRIDRPPVGVFNGRDILIVGALLTVLPVVYLHIPTAVLVGTFALLTTAIISFALNPLMGSRSGWAIAIVLVVVDIAAAHVGRESAPWIFAGINNLALAVAVVGVGNLWVQSGVRARHVAMLGTGLALYDLVATLALPIMGQFVERISTLPLAPMLTWGSGDGKVGIGLGDLLFLIVWTLVAEKAFSRRAALAAAALGMVCTFGLFMTFWFDLVNRPLPAMVALGPVAAFHYYIMIRRFERERTFAEYLASVISSRAAATVERPPLEVTAVRGFGPGRRPSRGARSESGVSPNKLLDIEQ
jgi:hypothetical protein